MTYNNSIYVENSSFEYPILEDSDFTSEPPAGWKTYNPSGLTTSDPDKNSVGVFNPPTTILSNQAPNGQNTGYVFSNTVPGSGVLGLTQTLDTVAAANTRYTLVADVGNPTGIDSDGFNYTGFPGYALALYAGDALLDYTINPVAIPEGGFKTVAFSYATDASDAIGEKLNIRLINLNAGSGLDVEFDRVQLIAEPATNSKSIEIKNSSFEEIPLADNGFVTEPPPSWRLYDPNGLLSNPNTDSDVGTFNPPKTNYFNETTGQLFSSTKRENTGYLFVTEQLGSGVVGLSQTLDTKLTANTHYKVEVDVGNPTGTDTADTGLSFEGFPGYRVELLAGDKVVATDNNTLQIAEGNFAISRVDFTASADNPLLGENLQIRLTNLNSGKGLEVDFDQVAIFSESVKDSSSVFIDNASFEQPILTDGDFSLTPPPGWELYNPDGLVPNNPGAPDSAVDTFNPDKSSYPKEAADGRNVGAVYLTQTPGSGVAGLSQTLDTVLAANTKYTLQADVGNIDGSFEGVDLSGFPGYRVELLAGDTVLASEQNNLFIKDGTFETSKVTFTTTDNSLYLGQNLGIRLVNVLQGSGLEVDFDNVRLTAQALPGSCCDSHSLVA